MPVGTCYLVTQYSLDVQRNGDISLTATSCLQNTSTSCRPNVHQRSEDNEIPFHSIYHVSHTFASNDCVYCSMDKIAIGIVAMLLTISTPQTEL